MKTIKLPATSFPSKINSQQLLGEIASGLGLEREAIGFQSNLADSVIVDITMFGQQMIEVPAYISISVPDHVSTSSLESIVQNHNPEFDDAEEIANAERESFKQSLRNLANDPEMIALIKMAAQS